LGGKEVQPTKTTSDQSVVDYAETKEPPKRMEPSISTGPQEGVSITGQKIKTA